jgi:hypothetical protein
MGTTRDFFTNAMADVLLPMLQRSMEDAVYETLDTRQVPTRTDFKEVRDLVNSLRGQVTGTTRGIERLVARMGAIEARLTTIETKLSATTSTVPSAPKSHPKACKVPDCDDAFRSKGFCGRHYQQWRRGRLKGFPLAQ